VVQNTGGKGLVCWASLGF